MAQEVNELLDKIVAGLTETAQSQTFDFNHSMECSATTLTALTRQVIMKIERLVQNGDISVDMDSKIIYLKNTPLDILSLLPIMYPEMDNDRSRESERYVVFLDGADIGSVVYKGPAESDFKRGILGLGHKANLILREKARYISVDIKLDQKGD